VPVFIAPAVAVLFMLHPIQTSAGELHNPEDGDHGSMFSFAGLFSTQRSYRYRENVSAPLCPVGAFLCAGHIFEGERGHGSFMLPVYDSSSSRRSNEEFRKSYHALCPHDIPGIGPGVRYGYRGFMKKIVTLLANPHQP